MSTILISSNILREAKRLFSKLRYQHSRLPVLSHILLSAGPDGVRLSVTDLDHWLETRICTNGHDPACFLIPPDAMATACRADRGTLVSLTAFGGRRSKDLGVVIHQGGIEATSVHPTLDPNEFPARPELTGETFTVPPTTLQSLAVVSGCASKDSTRYILNGVHFTPGDGGMLVATDGRRLACCPAEVPPHEFCLPSLAVSVLEHPGFSCDLVDITWLDTEDPELRQVAFRSGQQLLIARTLNGSYPNFRQVIPTDARELVVIPHERRPGVIAWLRSFGKAPHANCSVRLDWQKRGQLTLTHRDTDGRSSFLQVPVEVHGKPPVIAFNPLYLAEALEIGSTLCLSDEMSPGVCRHPSGRFCVIMPMRVTASTEVDDNEAKETAQAA